MLYTDEGSTPRLTAPHCRTVCRASFPAPPDVHATLMLPLRPAAPPSPCCTLYCTTPVPVWFAGVTDFNVTQAASEATVHVNVDGAFTVNCPTPGSWLKLRLAGFSVISPTGGTAKLFPLL